MVIDRAGRFEDESRHGESEERGEGKRDFHEMARVALRKGTREMYQGAGVRQFP
jgi:hypothetical protein